MSARAEGRPGRRSLVGPIRAAARPLAVTLLLTAVLLTSACLTATAFRRDHASIVSHVGMSRHALQTGRLWTLPAATFIEPHSVVLSWRTLTGLAFLAVVAAALEYQAGGRRLLVAFFLSDWISSPLAILVLWPAAGLGSTLAEDTITSPDVGSSAAAFGAATAAAVMLARPWREVALAGLLVFLVAEFGWESLGACTAHVIAAPVGLAFGLHFARRHRLRSIPLPAGPLSRKRSGRAGSRHLAG